MSVLKKNIAANLTGNTWQAFMSVAFVPLYVKFMGVESYGLVGIYASLQAMCVLLDMGLSATLTREMARLSVLPDREQEMRDLVRSLEVIYWFVAVFVGMAVIAAAPFISHHWVKAGQLSPDAIQQALRIMGFAMVLQWPASFYSGGLIGLQRQVLLNAVKMGVSTLRGTGAVLVLWLVSPAIQVFFAWQVFVSVVNTCLLAFALWHRLPRARRRATFQPRLLAGVWRFAAGMSGIAVLSTIFTQMDKVILSKMLTLEMFGYYTLAGIVGMSLYRLIGPVFSAVYPRFTQLVSLADEDGLTRLYHKSCQSVAVLILPVASVIAMFSYEILWVWTQNAVTAEKTYILASLLTCGTALFGLLNLPYALQLAHGWTKLSFYTNLIGVMAYIPMLIYMTGRYGALGGAVAWVVLNVGEMLIPIHLMHRRLLRHEKWNWYRHDVSVPLLTSLAVAGCGRLLLGESTSQAMIVVLTSLVAATALIVTSLSMPTTRTWVFSRLLSIETP